MNPLKIEKTGNFWIDNGIVGLYRTLCNLEYDDVSEITADGLELSFADEQQLTEAFNKARTEVVTKYLKKTGNFGWIYKDSDFEIYERTDFKMHLKPFFTGKTPKTEGALLIPEVKDSELGGKGRRMTVSEYAIFQKFKEESSGKIENNKKIKIENKGFLNTPPSYEIGNNFDLSFLEVGKKICSFSGKGYKLTDTVTGMDYPFLTGKSGELNFSSFLEGKPQLSTLYSFIALFSFYNLNYLLQGDMKHYFVLYDNNLESLSEFLNSIILNVEQVSKPDWSSFETEIIGTEYESEALFNFLLSIYSQLKSNFEEDEYAKKNLFTKTVFTLSNDGNIFRDVKEYTSLTNLFNLFETFESGEKDQSYYTHFKNFVMHFTQRLDSGKYDTTWRDKLCNAILNFRSVASIVENYLGEVKVKEEKGSVPYLDKILLIYNQKTKNKMNADLVNLCQKIGINIGVYSCAEKDRSCLYSLRNAKSRVEFLKALELIQFRIMESDKIQDQYKTKNYQDFFTNLPDGREWEEMKSMVSIFSMNSYLYEKQKSNKEESK
ncbi:MAG TPA: hypothetical protein PKE30_03585 [Niabella sp.]|nr:hypothetical protein [Niabella sp.]